MDWVIDEARLAEAKFGQMSILRRWDLFDFAMILFAFCLIFVIWLWFNRIFLSQYRCCDYMYTASLNTSCKHSKFSLRNGSIPSLFLICNNSVWLKNHWICVSVIVQVINWEKLKKHTPNEERKAQEGWNSVTPAPANSGKYKHLSLFIQYEVHHA